MSAIAAPRTVAPTALRVAGHHIHAAVQTVVDELEGLQLSLVRRRNINALPRSNNIVIRSSGNNINSNSISSSM